MNIHRSGAKFFRTAISLALLLGFLGSSLAQSVGHAQDQDPDKPAIVESDLFLPAVLNGYVPPRPWTVFGVEAEGLGDQMMDFSRDAETYWVRHFEISWKKIEPTEPNPDHTYDWSKVWDGGIVNVAERDMHLIAIVSYAPEWAQMDPPGVDCGPIDPDHLDEFAEFMGALVERYSASPFNVLDYEIGNEEDGVPDPSWPDRPYGCWGDPTDPYYGGEYYGEMLNHVYPAVKAANPEARVIVGGLLMGCDPRADPEFECDRDRTKFFEGILNNPIAQTGDNFDIVAFHGYGTYQSGGIVYYDPVDEWPNGGIIFGKADYLRYVMDQYGVDKPLMLTEASFICSANNTNCPNSTFYQRQADILVKIYAESWANDFPATIWYSLYSDWRHSALLYKPSSNWLPRPAFDAYEYMATRMVGFSYSGEVDYPGVAEVKGYEFQDASETIQVIWSTDGSAHNISVAGGPDVYNLYGTLTQTNAIQVSVNRPVYLVWD